MGIQKIVSPLPGIFYRKPAPDEPAYKSKATRSRKTTPLVSIES